MDHLCRNPSCWNPKHLEAVTRRENVRRSLPYRTNEPRVYKPIIYKPYKPKKNHCPLGHPLTDDNVFQRPGSNRYFCRQCVGLYVRMKVPGLFAEERPHV